MKNRVFRKAASQFFSHWQRFPCVLSLAMFVSGCQGNYQDDSIVELTGDTMGTTYQVVVTDRTEVLARDRLNSMVSETLSAFESSLSTYLPESEISTFNRSSSTQSFPASELFCQAVEGALVLGTTSHGAFDITVGRLVNLWGFGPGEVPSSAPDQREIDAALAHTGLQNLQTDCANGRIRKTDGAIAIDLSAYAKGLAVDHIAEILSAAGSSNYLVEIGGEVRTMGFNGQGHYWRIAIEQPLDTSRDVQRVVSAPELAIATSGDYRNFYVVDNQRYSHTIDPQSGTPVEHPLAAVTVIADDTATADALATALMVMGPVAGPKFANEQDIAAIFLAHEGDDIVEIASDRFRAQFPDNEPEYFTN